MIDYKNDPRFDEIHPGVYFLKDTSIADLHKSREVEAQIQNIYSNSGATASFINLLATQGIKMIEDDPKNEQLRQNMLSLFHELQFRTQNPVDSLCGIRMGAILSFMDGEPEEINNAWIEKKIEMAQSNPDLWAFFLSWGIANTPSYSSLLDILKDRDYFNKRKEMLMSLSSSTKK